MRWTPEEVRRATEAAVAKVDRETMPLILAEKHRFLAWINLLRARARGCHWHDGQTCREPGCRHTMVGAVGWMHPNGHVSALMLIDYGRSTVIARPFPTNTRIEFE